jgi:hypothetical protein
MNRNTECLTTVAALRPWPFGPPLRGRAPRSDGGQRVAPWRTFRFACARQKTTAPVGASHGAIHLAV